MDIEIMHRPSYSLAIAKLAPNEKIRAEAGAMVSMSSSVSIETKAEGGILKSLGRAMLGGESFFQNSFVASASGGEVTLAPELPGDIAVIEMSGNKLMIQSGSYMASESTIELTAKVSVKALMSAEGVSMLEATGTGTLTLRSASFAQLGSLTTLGAVGGAGGTLAAVFMAWMFRSLMPSALAADAYISDHATGQRAVDLANGLLTLVRPRRSRSPGRNRLRW